MNLVKRILDTFRTAFRERRQVDEHYLVCCENGHVTASKPTGRKLWQARCRTCGGWCWEDAKFCQWCGGRVEVGT